MSLIKSTPVNFVLLAWQLGPSPCTRFPRLASHTCARASLHPISLQRHPPLSHFAQGSACPPTCSYLTTPLSAMNVLLVLSWTWHLSPPWCLPRSPSQAPILASLPPTTTLLPSSSPNLALKPGDFSTCAAVLFSFSHTDTPYSAAWDLVKMFFAINKFIFKALCGSNQERKGGNTLGLI